jgi:hypothetical protein
VQGFDPVAELVFDLHQTGLVDALSGSGPILMLQDDMKTEIAKPVTSRNGS